MRRGKPGRRVSGLGRNTTPGCIPDTFVAGRTCRGKPPQAAQEDLRGSRTGLEVTQDDPPDRSLQPDLVYETRRRSRFVEFVNPRVHVGARTIRHSQANAPARDRLCAGERTYFPPGQVGEER